MATLIYHSGALGDFITTLPAIGVWRRLHPGVRAVLLGRPALAALAEPPFDAVIDAGSAARAPLFAPQPVEDEALRRMFDGVDSALLFASSRSALPTNLTMLGVKEIVRQDPFPSERVHVVDYHLSLFPDRVLTAADRLPRIRIPAAGSAMPPRCVALHCGSGSGAKNWPRERFLDLGRALAGEGARVAWVSGPAEEREEAAPGMVAWPSLPLSELAFRLSRCSLFVGNDSGVTHLAAAVSCPTVALFGVTDPAVWQPRGKNVHVIASATRTMGGIGLEEVVRLCLVIVASR
jgi:ADP-heptose:LPS heptosyltransferase